MREKLFGNVNEYKVSKFEACYREYFFFTVFSFPCICGRVKHASLCKHRHIIVFTFLHLHTTKTLTKHVDQNKDSDAEIILSNLR